MTQLTTEEIQEALDTCASEPIHIPGVTQPFGVVLGLQMPDLTIQYASDNTETILGVTSVTVLGQSIEDLLGRDAKHNIGNALGQTGHTGTRTPAGAIEIEGRAATLHISGADTIRVLEIEPVPDGEMPEEQQLHTVTSLMAKFQAAQSSLELMELVVRVLRTLSGYDRVMAYQFDSEFNGTIIAEAKSRAMETFMGLRFPHWDIPAQARAMMTKLPLRFIADIDAPPVPIHALTKDLPPFDISQAHLRGVSKVHLQYLENMGIRGTMTLSVMVDGQLWGIISFHHRKPRVPSNVMRRVYCAILPIINAKMQALLNQEALALHDEIDKIRGRVQAEVDADTTLEGTIEDYVSAVLDNFSVNGVFVSVGEEQTSHGNCPPKGFVDRIRAHAQNAGSGVWSSNALPELFGVDPGALNGVCGATCLVQKDGRAIYLFRNEEIQSLRWAGSPVKDIEQADGVGRLMPRGSFALYKETKKGQSTPWMPHDTKLVQSIAQTLLAANQRRMVAASMRRQQDLVIDELNHRVRNILSLVRSISRQARRHNSSLESYSYALEQRLNALAVAHDLGTGKNSGPVSIREIVNLEAEPFSEGNARRLVMQGDDFALLPEAAPIMALVIHELMTNAAKYGALSADGGYVSVDLTRSDSGASLFWSEHGGPTVSKPESLGFGSTLIMQAVPYELGGTSDFQFLPDGVEARLDLPNSVLGELPIASTPTPRERQKARGAEQRLIAATGCALVLEDNFMIATDMSNSLNELGYDDVEIASNLKDARAIMEDHRVCTAILDINLGRGGTSIEFARELARKRIPFVFVTGYGEIAPLPDDLALTTKLQKPVSYTDLEEAMDEMTSRIHID